MQFKCTIKCTNKSFINPIILPSSNNVIISNDFLYFKRTLNMETHELNLDAYNYLPENKKKREYYIFKEIIDNYDIDTSTHICLFADTITFISTIQELFNGGFLYTKNKLCSVKKKHIIHCYDDIIDIKDSYKLIIIHFEFFKQLYTNIIIALYKQTTDGTLIFSVPTILTDSYINLISFVSNFYDVTIIKPLFVSSLDETKYVIGRRKNKHPCFRHIIRSFSVIKTSYFTLDTYDPTLYLINKLTKEMMIWRCYFLTLILKNNKEHELSEKHNKIFIKKWCNTHCL